MAARASTPLFEADLKKQGTRLKGWATRRCTVADKTLSYTHRFGGSQRILLTKDTFIHLDDCDVRITAAGEHEPQVFRAPTRRLAMQLKAALLQEIGWQKTRKLAEGEGCAAVAAAPGPNGGDAAAVRFRAGDQHTLEHTRSLKLCQAAAEGAVDVILGLAATHDDVNCTVTGSTPLHWACFEGKTECVKQLLKLGASLDVEDHTSMVPAETCVFLANRNKRKTLAILARAQHERRRAAQLYSDLVRRVRQRHPGVTSANLQRVVIDFGLGRSNVDAVHSRSYPLEYPLLFAGPDGLRSRTDTAIAMFLRVKRLQEEETTDCAPATGRVETGSMDTSCFEQYSCTFPRGTLGMYFSGKDHNSDVKIDQLAADSVALHMGCQPGDLLLSVCGTDCRGRGLQHAIGCVLHSQDLPERTFVFGRLRTGERVAGR